MTRKEIFNQLVGKIIMSKNFNNYFEFLWRYVDGIINDPNFDGNSYEISGLETKNGQPLVIY